MKKGYTDIIVVLDRSGSMGCVRTDTIGGFNTFLEDQKKAPGEATLTLVQFDDQYDMVHENLVLDKIPALNTESFVPRGMTALYDAVGKTINSVGEKYKDMSEDERPEDVVFVILTDGYENDSNEFTSDVIKDLITEQTEKWNWNFVFLGANQDACLTAKGLGITIANAMTYSHDSHGIENSLHATSMNLTNLRSGKVKNLAYSEQDREMAVSK